MHKPHRGAPLVTFLLLLVLPGVSLAGPQEPERLGVVPRAVLAWIPAGRQSESAVS